jgi:hypothetical protein
MGRSRRLRYAWVIVLLAEVGVLVYGVMAAVAPTALVPGYESYSSRTWPALVAADTQTAAFVLLLFRLLGAYNVAFAVLAIAIAATAFRRRRLGVVGPAGRQHPRLRCADDLRPAGR